MTKEKILKALYSAQNVYCDPQHPLKGGAGFYQPIYLDHRNLLTFPQERKIIIKELINSLSPEVNLIAGNETAGIALAGFLAWEKNLPMVYVRKKPKEGGSKKQVDGIIKPLSKVAIIDDMMVTGGNIERAMEVLQRCHTETKQALVISVVRDDLISKKFSDKNIKISYLVTFKEIVDFGIGNKKFNQEEIKSITEYLSDPLNWGRKNGFI